MLAALALAGPVQAADPTAAAAASKTDVTVGETFVVDVATSGPAGTVWTFPLDAGDERVDLRTVPSPDGAAPGTHRYEAAAFALGEVQVPSVAVTYRLPDGTVGTATTRPIPLRILSVLPKDPKEQKLVDIRGPLSLRIGRAFWIAVGVAAAVLVALAVLLWRRLRKRKEVPRPAAPAVTPDAAALLALDRLAASGRLHRGEFRGFYIELVAIAKEYLEVRLAAPVREMTSAETVAFLRDHPAAREQAPAVRDMALAADRVKFARGAALEEEALRHLAAARGMIAAVEARLRPRVDAAPGKVA
jgi:hypothetical protein